MPRNPYKAAVVVAVGCVMVALISGCGSGQLSQTAQSVTMTNAAEGRVGTIAIRDAQFGADRRPVDGDALYLPGQDVPLQVTIANDVTGTAGGVPSPDRLVEVSSPVARSARIVGDTRLAAGEVLVAGYERPGASTTVPGARAIQISLLGLTEPLRAAMTYPVEFTFARAGTVRLELPVENPQFLPPRAEEKAIYPPPEAGHLVGRPVSPREAGG